MDQKAEFQVLTQQNLDSLYSYARLMTRNEAEAEDLLQETLLKAFRAFASFKPSLSFKVWLLKIMKNAHVDRNRRLMVRPEEEWRGEEGSAKEVLLYPVPLNPEQILLRSVGIEEVRGAIRHLPTFLREVVELREIEELSYQEIAEIIGTPIGTVKSRLYHGRQLLRSSLRQASEGEVTSQRTVYGL